jgi:two-component system chemotaxis response regulator CheB
MVSNDPPHRPFQQAMSSLPLSDAGAPALFPRSSFDAIVIGASAGGIPALKAILKRVPGTIPCPIVIVQHLPPYPNTTLPGVLGFGSRLQTKYASQGDRLRAGTVFIAPPDAHVVIGTARKLELESGPKVQFARPSIDRFFETAAAAFRGRVLAIVLSGMGSDGARGVSEIKRGGGVVLVQDPASADAPWMPLAAIAACEPDLVLPLSAIPSAITSLCEVPGARELFCAACL